MKKLRILSAVSVSVVILCFACYYDNEEYLYPSAGTSCDTLNVTFSTTISGILANNCFSCHSNATAAASGNGIRLQDYADVKSRAASIAGSIKHAGGYTPMPKNGGMLKDCSIKQFDIWVKDGMPNN